jgi:hypothetical protein
MHQQINLPERDEITLCEAVTAFICGEAYDVRQWLGAIDESSGEPIETGIAAAVKSKQLQCERPPKEQVSDAARANPRRVLTEKQVKRLNELLARLQQAAYAGHIKFRAIKEGGNHAGGYTQIDPLYFYARPSFHWSQDVILDHNNDASAPWYFVHLDRAGFAALVQELGASVPIHKTGAPGRPSSKHLVEPEAQRRLNAGEYPKTLAEFAKQLAKWLRQSHPEAAPMTEKTICNAVRTMWNVLSKRPK